MLDILVGAQHVDDLSHTGADLIVLQVGLLDLLGGGLDHLTNHLLDDLLGLLRAHSRGQNLIDLILIGQEVQLTVADRQLIVVDALRLAGGKGDHIVVLLEDSTGLLFLDNEYHDIFLLKYLGITCL